MDNQHTGHRSNRDLWRANWTTSLTKTYATFLIEQVIQGNRSNNVFSKKAWKYVRDEFNKQTGHTFDRKQLKNRLDVLKKQYYTMKSLLDRSDFRWDEPRKMVIADDGAWARYIKKLKTLESMAVHFFDTYACCFQTQEVMMKFLLENYNLLHSRWSSYDSYWLFDYAGCSCAFASKPYLYVPPGIVDEWSA